MTMKTKTNKTNKVIKNKRKENKMIYINGKKASKEDIKILRKNITEGKTRATGHITKKGNLAITTSC